MLFVARTGLPAVPAAGGDLCRPMCGALPTRRSLRPMRRRTCRDPRAGNLRAGAYTLTGRRPTMKKLTGADALGIVADRHYGLPHVRLLARLVVWPLPPAANRGGRRTVRGRVVQPLRHVWRMQPLRLMRHSGGCSPCGTCGTRGTCGTCGTCTSCSPCATCGSGCAAPCATCTTPVIVPGPVIAH